MYMSVIELEVFDAARGDGKVEIVQSCLNTGIDVNNRNSDKQTDLHVAAERGHVRVVQCLLEHRRVNIEALDVFHRTDLYYAAKHRHLAVIKCLIKHGAYRYHTQYAATPLREFIEYYQNDITEEEVEVESAVETIKLLAGVAYLFQPLQIQHPGEDYPQRIRRYGDLPAAITKDWRHARIYDCLPPVLQAAIKAYYDQVVQEHAPLAKKRIDALVLQIDDNARYALMEKFILAKRLLLSLIARKTLDLSVMQNVFGKCPPEIQLQIAEALLMPRNIDVTIAPILAEELLIMLLQPVIKQLHEQYPLLKETIASLPQTQHYGWGTTFLAARQILFQSAQQWLASPDKQLAVLSQLPKAEQLQRVAQQIGQWGIDAQFIPILAPTVLAMVVKKGQKIRAIAQSITKLMSVSRGVISIALTSAQNSAALVS